MLPFVAVIPSGPSGRRDSVIEKCITKMAEGDKDALARLYEETHVAAYGFALSILKNTQDGTASDKAYISRQQALELACTHAGVAVADVLRWETEFDIEDGRMIYELEFETATKECQYDLDASTGEVLKYKVKDHESPGSSGTSGETYIGEAAARDAAFAHANVSAADVIRVEVELDKDDDVMIYEVQFETNLKKYEHDIHAVTGAVLSFEQKTKNTSGGTSSYSSSGSSTSSSSSGKQTEYIGEAAAKAAALAHANVSESQTKYIKCYYDYDHGQPVCYCVEFAVGDTRYEYEIDLYSGAVLKYEIDPHHS